MSNAQQEIEEWGGPKELAIITAIGSAAEIALWAAALCAIWNWLIAPETTFAQITYPLAAGVVLVILMFGYVSGLQNTQAAAKGVTDYVGVIVSSLFMPIFAIGLAFLFSSAF